MVTSGIGLGACIALPLTFLLAAFAPTAALAEAGTLIHLTPVLLEVGEGLTGAVEVRVEDVRGLYGYDIRLAFDPAVVQVVDADPGTAGVQVWPGGC